MVTAIRGGYAVCSSCVGPLCIFIHLSPFFSARMRRFSVIPTLTPIAFSTTFSCLAVAKKKKTASKAPTKKSTKKAKPPKEHEKSAVSEPSSIKNGVDTVVEQSQDEPSVAPPTPPPPSGTAAKDKAEHQTRYAIRNLMRHHFTTQGLTKQRNSTKEATLKETNPLLYARLERQKEKEENAKRLTSMVAPSHVFGGRNGIGIPSRSSAPANDDDAIDDGMSITDDETFPEEGFESSKVILNVETESDQKEE